MIMYHARCALLLAFVAWTPPVPAAEPPTTTGNELDALTLADRAEAAPDKAGGPWRIYLEGAGSTRRLDAPGETANAVRTSIDLRFDSKLSPGVRLIVSNRLDLVHDQSDRPVKSVNTLREAYFSWSRNDSQTIDLGRVNVRHGAALGYNPTDWFKEYALRGVVSPDPAALRENRQGTFVLQGQHLWPDGSVAFTLSPRLQRTRAADPSALSLDLGANNSRHRWLLGGSWRLGNGWTPELLVHGGEGASPQLGVNLTALAGDAVVIFGEFTSGSGQTLAALARQEAASGRRRERAALGFTYTTPINLSFTLEAEYNGAAPNRRQWQALQAVGPMATLQVLGTASELQDLPARRAVFGYATWKDAFVRRLDLSAFVRQELETRSRSQWIEARHRWDHLDLAVQLLLNSGGAGSIYRTSPLRHALEVSLRWYL